MNATKLCYDIITMVVGSVEYFDTRIVIQIPFGNIYGCIFISNPWYIELDENSNKQPYGCETSFAYRYYPLFDLDDMFLINVEDVITMTYSIT